jgi:hypothetical protein
MRVAQMKAVSSNVQYRVNFNDVPNGYIIQHQTSAGFVDEGSTQSLPSGIKLDSITFGGGLVVFNPNSTASSGNLVLENPKLTHKKITVSPTTGRVRID